MKPRILVADDDEKNLLLLTSKLASEGYEVESALDGREAVEKTMTFHPDLVILDVMMPVMSGYEALRRLKSSEATRYIPIIMLTARTEVEDKVMGLELGAEDYIAKPYSLSEVSARVKSLLRMRALQKMLRESEKLAALGEMVDGIAHEIRNPLTTIGGIARRLCEKETDEVHRNYSRMIIRAVERMEMMLQRIDEYKNVLVSKFEKADINELIRDVVKDARKMTGGKDIEFVTRLMPDTPLLYLDRANMKRALSNLVENAIEAIEGKGRITIETLPSDEQALVITVSDTGSGIREEDLRTIFNPFKTSKMTGAGLGLTITYRVIQDHGGDIDVESEPGKGTTFTIKLHPGERPPGH